MGIDDKSGSPIINPDRRWLNQLVQVGWTIQISDSFAGKQINWF